MEQRTNELLMTIQRAITLDKKLAAKREKIAGLEIEADALMEKICAASGLQLYQRSLSKPYQFFWRSKSRQESQYYDTMADAYTALLEDTIRW